MDNFRIDITSTGDLVPAMKIAFRHMKAINYRIDPQKGLIFGYNEAMQNAIALPFKLDAEGAADFARRWLEEQPYGNPPYHDEDNERAWRVYTDSWGHIDDEWASIVAIQPA